ncbi:hypothetical protein [Nonomuraea glycinis]|uniref:hypothetical protein n=1 Tax=Nonomuraea glycinis TaxID=2047744 RepID=UPI002E160376|nr:hypothetical protein OHA68_06940 [Nonomuraea glycinis]
MIAQLCEDDAVTVESFFAKVGDNLRAGKIRLVFVADTVPDHLRRIVEFLNEQMNPAEVLAVPMMPSPSGTRSSRSWINSPPRRSLRAPPDPENVRPQGPGIEGAAFLAAVAALTAATVAASGSNLCTARKASDFSDSLSWFRGLNTKYRI